MLRRIVIRIDFCRRPRIFPAANHLKINSIMTNKFSAERKAAARLLVDMLYERRSSTRNLRWIYNRYAKYLFGVSFPTFSSYLDRG